MKCPHCGKHIEVSPTVLGIEYRDDVGRRLAEATGNPSIGLLVKSPGSGSGIGDILEGIEQLLGAVELAYYRGRWAAKECSVNNNDDEASDPGDGEELVELYNERHAILRKKRILDLRQRAVADRLRIVCKTVNESYQEECDMAKVRE